ncbi:MAG: hypothetical protein M1818_003461 [Claussenomyces sp. TS43310]|nr:MAG: hypothetical protein M1818_003461 [Claussenomyces sp. TS43310]
MPSGSPAEAKQLNKAPETPGIPSGQQATNGAGLAPSSTSLAVTPATKVSGAEIKAQKKAEKAARRAQEILRKQVGPAVPAGGGTKPEGQSQGLKGPPKSGKDTSKGQQKRRGSAAGESRNMSFRGAQQGASLPNEPKQEDKTVELFRHLYKSRAATIAGAGKEVHPAVLALGQQMRTYVICGSNARLVATLQAFKRVIESYTTPPGNTLTRHLTSHVLSPQIEYLTSCRPLSVSMGTAIRWLKLKISKVDPDEPDASAKESLCEAIDEYVRDRVTLADKVIAKSASQQCIKDGDVILTFAKSSIVEQTLIRAHSEGRRFKVIVVDSRPLFEGKSLVRALVRLGMDTKYCLMNGLSHCIRDATKVLVGAHAMMSNGRLFSRIGTAQVAMEANDFDIPVIVLCESIKCTERVALDSIVFNEVAPPDELLLASSIPGKTEGTLAGWRETKNLQLLNLMYDVTPADYIAMIVTELGIVPPSSVPVLQRLANEVQ